MVSRLTPARPANACWVQPSLRRSARNSEPRRRVAGVEALSDISDILAPRCPISQAWVQRGSGAVDAAGSGHGVRPVLLEQEVAGVGGVHVVAGDERRVG